MRTRSIKYVMMNLENTHNREGMRESSRKDINALISLEAHIVAVP